MQTNPKGKKNTWQGRRNWRIAEKVLKGGSFAGTAQEFGISHQRARDITLAWVRRTHPDLYEAALGGHPDYMAPDIKRLRQLYQSYRQDGKP
jgi:hypothetical protein